jgi:hypothetical protein
MNAKAPLPGSFQNCRVAGLSISVRTERYCFAGAAAGAGAAPLDPLASFGVAR